MGKQTAAPMGVGWGGWGGVPGPIVSLVRCRNSWEFHGAEIHWDFLVCALMPMHTAQHRAALGGEVWDVRCGVLGVIWGLCDVRCGMWVPGSEVWGVGEGSDV